MGIRSTTAWARPLQLVDDVHTQVASRISISAIKGDGKKSLPRLHATPVKLPAQAGRFCFLRDSIETPTPAPIAARATIRTKKIRKYILFFLLEAEVSVAVG